MVRKKNHGLIMRITYIRTESVLCTFHYAFSYVCDTIDNSRLLPLSKDLFLTGQLLHDNRIRILQFILCLLSLLCTIILSIIF